MNNKGMAISSILYTILVLFLVLLFGILGLISSAKTTFDTLKNKIFANLNASRPTITYVEDEFIDSNMIISVTSRKYIDTYYIAQNSTTITKEEIKQNGTKLSYPSGSFNINYVVSNTDPYDLYLKDIHDNVYKLNFAKDKGSCEYEEGYVWDASNFPAGKSTKFIFPCDGIYTLDVRGAQGGTTNNFGSTTYQGTGGKGGRSYGDYQATAGDVVYVVVGKQGTAPAYNTTGSTASYGGYNGGGHVTNWDTNSSMVAGGGGCTHISTASGALSSTKSAIIVAGGGGGGYVANSTLSTATGGKGGGGTASATTGTGTNVGGTYGGYTKGLGGYSYGGGGSGCGWTPGAGVVGGSGNGGKGYLSGSLISGTTGGSAGYRSGNGYASITLKTADGGSSNLPYKISSTSLDSKARTTIAVNEEKTFTITVKNLTSANTNYELYYKQSNTNSKVKVIYTEDSVDTATGTIDASAEKTITVKVTNTGTVDSIIRFYIEMDDTFGVSATNGKEVEPEVFKCTLEKGTSTSLAYSSAKVAQEYTVPCTGAYRIELWGAQGGTGYGGSGGTSKQSAAPGSYTSGVIELEKGTVLYFYVGGKGTNRSTSNYSTAAGGWNGGVAGTAKSSGDTYAYGGGGGGGATDVRLEGGTWSTVTSLRSRIMVAAGGGGGRNAGLSGGLSNNHSGSYLANQTTGQAFGKSTVSSSAQRGGGAGGYWGGYSTNNSPSGSTSFISGHTGCVAVVSNASTDPRIGTNGATCETGTTDNLCSVHYSGYVFVDTKMIDSTGCKWTNELTTTCDGFSTPDGTATEMGHTGHGAAKITYLGE